MTFLYIGSAWFFFNSPQSLSIVFIFSSSQTSLSHSKPSTQVFFNLREHFLLLVCLFFIHSSCISLFDLTFGFLLNFWGFSKLMKFLWNFWDGFCVNDPKCSFIASHLHYNNVSFILDVCLLCCNVVCWWVWIGLSLWWFLILHVICSCIFMHMYLQFLIFFYIVLLVLFLLSFYLLLSLSCVSLLYGTQTQIHFVPKPSSF